MSDTPSRLIRIPTDQEIARGIYAARRFDFSFIDEVTDAVLERMDRENDRAVLRGICDGC